MKNFKKIALLVLTILLSLSLTACSGGNDKPAGGDDEPVVTTNPMYDVNVRKAILYGIDRDALVSARDDGATTALYGFVPSGLVSEEGDFRVVGGDYCKYDPEYAKECLAAAGYSVDNPLTLEYYYNQASSHDLVAAVVKEQLAKIGINLDLKTADVRTFFADRDENANFQLARGAMSADYADALVFLEMATSAYQMKQAWGDKTYDEMIIKASTQSGQERIDTLHAAEKYLVEEKAMVIPLFEYGSALLSSPKVKGVLDNFQGNAIFWFAENEGSDTLTYAIGDQPNYMDPAIATDSIGAYTINQMFFPLYYLGPDGITPGAAEKTEVSEDGLTYTITLKENYWSDGKKVTADDFVYGAKHALSIGDAEATYLSWITNYIEGAAEYVYATSEDMPNLGIKALDENTIEYKLIKPVAFFESLLWGGIYYPLRADFAPMGDYTWADTVGYPMCGAFIPTEIDRASGVKFVKNDKFCLKDQVKLNSLNVKVISDQDAQLMAFQTGEIDYATSLDSATVSKMPELADCYSVTGIINYYIELCCFDPEAN